MIRKDREEARLEKQREMDEAEVHVNRVSMSVYACSHLKLDSHMPIEPAFLLCCFRRLH